MTRYSDFAEAAKVEIRDYLLFAAEREFFDPPISRDVATRLAEDLDRIIDEDVPHRCFGVDLWEEQL